MSTHNKNSGDEIRRFPDKRWRVAGFRPRGYATERGFSLLAAAVIAGLMLAAAAATYPLLVAGRAENKREMGRLALYELAAGLEVWHRYNGSYAGAADSRQTPRATGPPWIMPATVPTGGGATYYRLRIVTANERGFEIHAVPVGAQADDPCGILTLTTTGARGVLSAAPGYGKRRCWTLMPPNGG